MWTRQTSPWKFTCDQQNYTRWEALILLSTNYLDTSIFQARKMSILGSILGCAGTICGFTIASLILYSLMQPDKLKWCSLRGNSLLACLALWSLLILGNSGLLLYPGNILSKINKMHTKNFPLSKLSSCTDSYFHSKRTNFSDLNTAYLNKIGYLNLCCAVCIGVSFSVMAVFWVSKVIQTKRG